MGEACSTHEKYENYTKYKSENLKDRRHLGGLNVDLNEIGCESVDCFHCGTYGRDKKCIQNFGREA